MPYRRPLPPAQPSGRGWNNRAFKEYWLVFSPWVAQRGSTLWRPTATTGWFSNWMLIIDLMPKSLNLTPYISRMELGLYDEDWFLSALYRLELYPSGLPMGKKTSRDSLEALLCQPLPLGCRSWRCFKVIIKNLRTVNTDAYRHLRASGAALSLASTAINRKGDAGTEQCSLTLNLPAF